MLPTFTFLIPVKRINSYIEEMVRRLNQLTSDDWEAIILPNDDIGGSVIPWSDKIRMFCTGRISPGEKRNIGAGRAQGSYLVFLDDDSYPSPGYLQVAKRELSESSAIAIGGPGVTPDSSTFFQKLSGAVFESTVGGGFPERYRSVGSRRSVTDWPSVNLILNKEEFERVGGFDKNHWPGEDTAMCNAISSNPKNKILYVPDLIVYHHRREDLISHLKQVQAYGFNRGYFARIGFKNSRSLKFAIPSIFLIYISFSPLIFTLDIPLFWGPLLAYVLAQAWVTLEVAQRHTLGVSVVTPFLNFLTHVTYGVGYIKGLLSAKPKMKLR